MVLDKVIDLVAEQLGVDKKTITAQSNIIEDLGADSLDVIPSPKIPSIEGNEVLAQAQIPDDFILVPGGPFSYKGNYYAESKY